MRALLLAIAVLAAAPVHAYSTTRCYWLGGTYTCQTFGGGGGISTTRCTSIGGTIRCTTY